MKVIISQMSPEKTSAMIVFICTVIMEAYDAANHRQV